ncbi:MAG: hypothetical protein HQL31_01490 [Planctomycetes bacterium]|nr:hypothetical protein [Planctomycetota bacterium]
MSQLLQLTAIDWIDERLPERSQDLQDLLLQSEAHCREFISLCRLESDLHRLYNDMEVVTNEERPGPSIGSFSSVRSLVAAALLLLGLGILFFVSSQLLSKDSAVHSLLCSSAGELTVIREDKSPVNLHPEETLSLGGGELISVSEGGKGLIELPHLGKIELREATRMTYRNSKQMELGSGSLFAKVQALPGGSRVLEIMTPEGVTYSVVGTAFEVQVLSGSSSRLRVFEGRVLAMSPTGSSEYAGPGEEILSNSSGLSKAGVVVKAEPHNTKAGIDPSSSLLEYFMEWFREELLRRSPVLASLQLSKDQEEKVNSLLRNNNLAIAGRMADYAEEFKLSPLLALQQIRYEIGSAEDFFLICEASRLALQDISAELSEVLDERQAELYAALLKEIILYTDSTRGMFGDLDKYTEEWVRQRNQCELKINGVLNKQEEEK